VTFYQPVLVFVVYYISIICLIAVALPMVSHWFFIQSLRKAKTKIPILVLLKSFGREIFCIFMAAFLKPFKNKALKASAHALKSKKPVIILVHGYLHNQTAWYWFKRQLEKADIGPVYTVNLTPFYAPIEQLATCIEAKIRSLQDSIATENLILIGHSMGGLVSSYYAENVTPHKIGLVITLASPLQGTLLANLGFGKCVKQMQLNAPFTKNLLKKIVNSTIPYLHIASKLDNIIVPWENAMPPLAHHNTYVVDDLGHLSFLISPKIIQIVLQHLAKI